MGAHADRQDQGMRLRAFVAEIDGSRLRRAEHVVSWPASETEAHEVGLSLGRTLLG
jgi:hydroxymethylbilane synthase